MSTGTTARLKALTVITGYVAREFTSLTVYVTAAVVGGAINFFQGTMALAPFLIPVIVQSVARGTVKYSRRLDSQLAVLPAMRPDPTFIMDSQGRIVLAAGRTREMFDAAGVASLTELLDADGRTALVGAMALCDPTSAPLEVCSPVLDKHFEAAIVPVDTHCQSDHTHFMCWFKDISPRVRLEERQLSLMEFANGLLEGVGGLQCTGDMDRLLAAHILETHAAVFIARSDDVGTADTDASGIPLPDTRGVRGHIYRRPLHEPKADPARASGVEISGLIEIPPDSNAPILLSARVDDVVFDSVQAYADPEQFAQAYPFTPPVRDFVGQPITGFANCQKGNIAVIAFNPHESFSPSDTLYFETLVNVSRSMEALMTAG